MQNNLDSKSHSCALRNLRIGKALDGRIKLTDEHRDQIKQLHREGYAIREIARMYEKVCSRRLIQFILFPERLEAMQKRAQKDKKWKTYYSRQSQKQYMRKHRSKLRKLYNLS